MSLPESVTIPSALFEIVHHFGGERICQGHRNVGGDMWVPCSFILFKNMDDAMSVHKGLSKTNDERILQSYGVIKVEIEGPVSSAVWLAVEEIECSLFTFLQRAKSTEKFIDSRLNFRYKQMIRDVIQLVLTVHAQRVHCILDSKHIFMVKNRVKGAFLHDTRPPSLDFADLKNLFLEILGSGMIGSAIYMVEVVDFHELLAGMVDFNHILGLKYHPLLLTPEERLMFPVLIDTRVRLMDCKAAYRQNVNTSVRQLYSWMNVIRTGWQNTCYDKLSVSKKYIYKDSVWCQQVFMRNVPVHLNDDRVIKSENEMDADLTAMFPKFLCQMFKLDLEEKRPST